ncbi:MAG: hypothetical protein IJC99_00510 [Clostridia bacterium]|nr:hypothetical protein [Clostridia bacterium]
MFCQKCGKEIDNEAIICVGCGCAVAGKYAAPATPAPQKEVAKSVNPALVVWSWICAVLMPFISIILSIIGLSKYKNASGRGSFVASLIASSVYFVFYLIFIIIMAS